jgi:hypothetical protein
MGKLIRGGLLVGGCLVDSDAPVVAGAHAASIIQEDGVSYILLEDGTSSILQE